MSMDMMRATPLITPRELPVWVPGKVVCASDGQGWKDVGQRSYLYKGQDVEIPPMETFMIVHYRQGETPMDRKVEERWKRTRCQPGNFSLLSRSAESHWHWTDGVEVSHLYLSNNLMCRVASELRDREVNEVHLHDVLRGSDPIVSHVSDEITREAQVQSPGGPLYVEALSVQLAVHLLRNYASCFGREQKVSGGLSAKELARLEDFIDANLHETITLEDMAASLGMGVWTFVRQLRRAMNCSAYAYVVDRRVARAKRLLQEGELALKEIAAACGFSDQAHMTRTFRSRLRITPGRFRKEVSRPCAVVLRLPNLAKATTR